jgi:hypothetical protein
MLDAAFGRGRRFDVVFVINSPRNCSIEASHKLSVQQAILSQKMVLLAESLFLNKRVLRKGFLHIPPCPVQPGYS